MRNIFLNYSNEMIYVRYIEADITFIRRNIKFLSDPAFSVVYTLFCHLSVIQFVGLKIDF